MTQRDGAARQELILATYSMAGHVYFAVPSEEEQFLMLDRAYELGATFWDSAE